MHLKKSWMIQEFNTRHPMYIVIAQPFDAHIIHSRAYDIGGIIQYNIMVIKVVASSRCKLDRINSRYAFEFDDMLLKPPEKEYCNIVNKLPTELLFDIFERLDMHDFFELVQVCKRFRAIALASRINDKLRVGIPSLPLWKLDNYLSSFGSHVRNVEIIASLSIHIPFKLITQYCKNIRELTIRISHFSDHPDVSELYELIRGVEKAHIVTHGFNHELPPSNCMFTSLYLASKKAAPAHHFTHLTELQLYIYMM